MSEQAAALDRDRRRAFVAQQLMRYREENPEIRRVIYRIWEIAKNDFLAAMWSIFRGLESIRELLGKLPVIQKDAADQTWAELHEAPDDILDGEPFDDFRSPIEMEFRLNLEVSVASPEVKIRAKRTFAMILRMIQIELKRSERAGQSTEAIEGG